MSYKKNVKLKCHYMAYGCGECHAQYKIWDVEEGNDINKKDLVGKDLKIVFKDNESEKKLDSLVSKCTICYDFYFEGVISKPPTDTFLYHDRRSL